MKKKIVVLVIVLLLVIGLLYANRSVGTVAGGGDLTIIHSYEGYNEAGEIKVFTQQYTVPANHPAYAQLSALVTGVKLRASIPTEFSNLAGQASITGENYRFSFAQAEAGRGYLDCGASTDVVSAKGYYVAADWAGLSRDAWFAQVKSLLSDIQPDSK
jgi:hypothetical protein